MATKKAKKKAANAGRTALVVDFSDTESSKGQRSQRRKHFKPGDYAVKVGRGVKSGKSPEKKSHFVEVPFTIIDGKNKGETIRDKFYTTAKAAWRIRKFIEATGSKVPSKKAKVDFKKYIGKKLAITIDDDVWENDEGEEQIKSEVVDFFLLSELEKIEDEDIEIDEDDDEEDEDEEDDDEDEDEEDEDEEDDDDEDLDDIDLDEL